MVRPTLHWSCFRWSFALVALLLTMTTATAQEAGESRDDPREQWQAAIEAGNKYIEEGEFEKAVASFSEVIRVTKNNIMAGAFRRMGEAGPCSATSGPCRASSDGGGFWRLRGRARGWVTIRAGPSD